MKILSYGLPQGLLVDQWLLPDEKQSHQLRGVSFLRTTGRLVRRASLRSLVTSLVSSVHGRCNWSARRRAGGVGAWQRLQGTDLVGGGARGGPRPDAAEVQWKGPGKDWGKEVEGGEASLEDLRIGQCFGMLWTYILVVGGWNCQSFSMILEVVSSMFRLFHLFVQMDMELTTSRSRSVVPWRCDPGQLTQQAGVVARGSRDLMGHGRAWLLVYTALKGRSHGEINSSYKD